MPSKKKAPDYYGHLESLRINIITIVVFFVLSGLLSFVFIEKIMGFLQEPLKNTGVNLYYFKPQEKFLTYIKVAFFSGLFFTVPFSVFVLGSFVYPGLRKNEKKYFFTFTLLIPLVFVAGGFFAYKVITPVAFAFLINFAAGDNVNALWGVSAYFNFLISVIFVMGIVFLIPLGFFGLMKTGIITPRRLANLRPAILMGILVIAAFFTPPDIITQVLVGAPLYLLFEVSLFMGRLAGK